MLEVNAGLGMNRKKQTKSKEVIKKRRGKEWATFLAYLPIT
jgi:hypothetical protein